MADFNGLLNDYLESVNDSDWLELKRIKYMDLGFRDRHADKFNCLASLYRGVTGSDYCILPCGADLQAIDVLIMLLLHFRYMTVEQFNMLFPFHSRGLLKSLKGYRSKSFGQYFNSTAYDGKNCVYTLSPDVYDAYSGLFPDGYRAVVDFMSRPRTSSRAVLNHDVSMCDVPYGCLAAGLREPLRWYCYAPLSPGLFPAEAAASSMSRKEAGGSVMNSPDSVIPDAIMLLSGDGVIVEQDMCTERISRITGKFEAYGKYFSSLNGPMSHIQLLFNVSAPLAPVKGTRTRGVNTLAKLKVFSDAVGSDNLQQVYISLRDVYRDRPDNSARNMISLITEFYPDENERFQKTVGDLDASLSGRKDLETRAGISERGRKINDRVSDIARAFREFRNSSSPASYSFFAAIKRGLSLVVTCDYRRYCRYFNPFGSGEMDVFLNSVKQKYARSALTPYCVRGITLEIARSRTVMRNCIAFRLSGGKTFPLLYVFSEVSFDIAERIRMADLIGSYDRKDIDLHLVFIVRDTDAAIGFCSETKCIEKFCRMDNPLEPNESYNVSVRFFSMDERRYFIVNQFGNVYDLEEDNI